MPNPLDRNPENISGPFYVDSSCIDCDICRGNAPQFFNRWDEGGYTVVHTQPVTEEEIAQAIDAMNECPSESIGRE
jgi:ferredoxin